jgi:hypothetical protein
VCGGAPNRRGEYVVFFFFYEGKKANESRAF